MLKRSTTGGGVVHQLATSSSPPPPCSCCTPRCGQAGAPQARAYNIIITGNSDGVDKHLSASAALSARWDRYRAGCRDGSSRDPSWCHFLWLRAHFWCGSDTINPRLRPDRQHLFRAVSGDLMSASFQGGRGPVYFDVLCPVLTSPSRRRWPNVVLTLFQRRRRWKSVKTTLGQRFLLLETWNITPSTVMCWAWLKCVGLTSSRNSFIL